jgi:hypothetical protein
MKRGGAEINKERNTEIDKCVNHKERDEKGNKKKEKKGGKQEKKDDKTIRSVVWYISANVSERYITSIFRVPRKKLD